MRTAKHLRNLSNQQDEQNNIFKFDDSLFNQSNKKWRLKCKICRIKVDDLQKHLRSFSNEKKVNPAMRISEVYRPLNKNETK